MSSNRPVTFILALLTLFIGLVSHVQAEQENEGSMFFDLSTEEQPAAVSPRYTRPISSIAENATVITAEQIALLNAHTLADVLQTIPGVQLTYVQTPGSFTDFSIQGAETGFSHVLVLIDGVKQNNQLQGMASPGQISIQQIERVEIIKGAASGSWGQALGGVINIVTKTPNSARLFGGVGSTSLGERGTRDNRGEVSGTFDRFGYYLSGGSLHSGVYAPITASIITMATPKSPTSCLARVLSPPDSVILILPTAWMRMPWYMTMVRAPIFIPFSISTTPWPNC